MYVQLFFDSLNALATTKYNEFHPNYTQNGGKTMQAKRAGAG
jgi:hypothetical protein